MNAKEALDKIRQLFEETAPAVPPVDPAPQKMEAKEYVLEDGTKVLVSDLEVGGMVAVVAEDGSTSRPRVGEHKVADGTVITVAENGVITSVAMPAAPAAGMPEEEMVARFAAVASSQHAIKVSLSAENEALRNELKAMNVKLKGLADVVASLVDMPAAAPLQEPRNTFSATGTSKEEKMKRVQSIFDKLKKGN
jgi:hypothetical protein